MSGGSVTERRRELAIRIALGAHPGALAWLVTAQGLALAAGGVAVGLAVAQLAHGLLAGCVVRNSPDGCVGDDRCRDDSHRRSRCRVSGASNPSDARRAGRGLRAE